MTAEYGARSRAHMTCYEEQTKELARAFAAYWINRPRTMRHAVNKPVENVFGVDNECAPPAQTSGALPYPTAPGGPVERSRTVLAARDNSGEAA